MKEKRKRIEWRQKEDGHREKRYEDRARERRKRRTE